MSKKLLVIGYVWPEPQTTAAGQRMLQLLNAFLDFGYDITFASTAAKTHYSLNLEGIGVKTGAIQLNHDSFDQFVKELKPSVVLFDRFMVEEQFGWRVAEQVPDALRILNTEDLHSLRKTREAYHKKGEEFRLKAWKSNPDTKREVASIYRSDLSLLVSTYEMELLTEELKVPHQIVMHLPFMLPKLYDKTKASYPSFEQRTGFITYGNGKHAPNVDTIKYLKQTIWPLIRKELPDASIKIFGAYFSEQILALNKPKDGFHVMGWVDDLDAEIQKARICLAPLRFGAGIKGKLVQAMQNGTPGVTTTIGAEGISHQSHWPGYIADEPVEFVEAALKLHSKKKYWEKAQKVGFELVNQNFSENNWKERLHNRLNVLHDDLEAHRLQNFMGGLLQHQTMASTKYMGKWITEKNKKC